MGLGFVGVEDEVGEGGVFGWREVGVEGERSLFLGEPVFFGGRVVVSKGDNDVG